MAGYCLALSVLLLHAVRFASSACTNGTCSECATAADCVRAPGCYPQSSSKYSPQLCVTCATCSEIVVETHMDKRSDFIGDEFLDFDGELGCRGGTLWAPRSQSLSAVSGEG